MDEIRRIEEAIRSLEVQGARNVAIAGLKCMKICALEAEASTSDDLLDQMSKVAGSVARVRVTEPMLRNVLANVLFDARRSGKDVSQLRRLVAAKCDALTDEMSASMEKMTRYGSALVKDDCTVFTHCHSSSVTSLIVRASKTKTVRVICTETRPRWQGRKTARELAENGVDVTMFVDSAARMYMGEADLVLIGADAVGGGMLYNKIGSYMVVHFAGEAGVPAYSVCETQKFDPLVGIGYVQPVEQRPPAEVIEGRVPFKVRNPAFETVPLSMFSGLVTEKGILDSEEAERVMHDHDHLIPMLKKLVDWDKWKEA